MKSHLASWILERLSFVGFWLAGWFMFFSLQGMDKPEHEKQFWNILLYFHTQNKMLGTFILRGII